mmetsp:Transcript_15889/g.48464  ORF Transcript_15889/g.48464 Transcript_15889/m.48464 type:complete len:224 (-) Transcript_15889:178-849(-)
MYLKRPSTMELPKSVTMSGVNSGSANAARPATAGLSSFLDEITKASQVMRMPSRMKTVPSPSSVARRTRSMPTCKPAGKFVMKLPSLCVTASARCWNSRCISSLRSVRFTCGVATPNSVKISSSVLPVGAVLISPPTLGFPPIAPRSISPAPPFVGAPIGPASALPFLLGPGLGGGLLPKPLAWRTRPLRRSGLRPRVRKLGGGFDSGIGLGVGGSRRTSAAP